MPRQAMMVIKLCRKRRRLYGYLNMFITTNMSFTQVKRYSQGRKCALMEKKYWNITEGFSLIARKN